MKKVLWAVFIAAFVISCKQDKKSDKEIIVLPEEKATTVDLSRYPENLQKVFARHGGLDNWQEQQSLTYKIKGNEIHYINLKDRKDRVDGENFKIGFDGKDVWLHADEGAYKGNARFYHNLFFYFYAMPFVLADEGVNYSEATPLTFEGTEYPGIRISYDNGVGDSPEDEYYLYYNPDTYQMEWLGYTVTYATGEKSDDVHWIRYNDWTDLKGLLLPNSITWYDYEDDTIKEPKSTIEFKEAELSEVAYGDNVFDKPEGATVIEK
ncbi:DUF6503 family protein [Sungkyunkwania multivorans]|uniref:DUF6503 family protein n=1 Tax=Sungkyunkwania multivorans TaxID=1173618 RepID=A0ABW3CVK2_9FLAO